MRAPLFCALALLGASIVCAASSSRAHPCGSAPDPDALQRAKPSSFAPHRISQNRVYGAPIQSRILKRTPKKTPQLKSAPLPES